MNLGADSTQACATDFWRLYRRHRVRRRLRASSRRDACIPRIPGDSLDGSLDLWRLAAANARTSAGLGLRHACRSDNARTPPFLENKGNPLGFWSRRPPDAICSVFSSSALHSDSQPAQRTRSMSLPSLHAGESAAASPHHARCTTAASSLSLGPLRLAAALGASVRVPARAPCLPIAPLTRPASPGYTRTSLAQRRRAHR